MSAKDELEATLRLSGITQGMGKVATARTPCSSRLVLDAVEPLGDNVRQALAYVR